MFLLTDTETGVFQEVKYLGPIRRKRTPEGPIITAYVFTRKTNTGDDTTFWAYVNHDSDNNIVAWDWPNQTISYTSSNTPPDTDESWL